MSARISVKPGDMYGMLTIIKEITEQGRPRRMLCSCECGKIKEINLGPMRHGSIVSCGCYGHSGLARTHGMRKHPLYNVWLGIKQRCFNPNSVHYSDYGGRGITMCQSWVESFQRFFDDVSKGYCKGLEIDRIDNNGNYEPENVRWVTRKENLNNTRTSIHVIYNGVSINLIELSNITGVCYSTLYFRHKKGRPLF